MVLCWRFRQLAKYGVNDGGSAASEATCLTLEVPPAPLAEWCADGTP